MAKKKKAAGRSASKQGQSGAAMNVIMVILAIAIAAFVAGSVILMMRNSTPSVHPQKAESQVEETMEEEIGENITQSYADITLK